MDSELNVLGSVVVITVSVRDVSVVDGSVIVVVYELVKT